RARRCGASIHLCARTDVRYGDGREGRLMQQWMLAKSVGWFGADWGPAAYETAANLFFILLIVIPLMGCVAYLTLWERKVIGWIQIRIAPHRVRPCGLL